MSVEERAAFLLHGTRTGKLATVRRDGRPHVQPVWFVLDEDGTVVFMTGSRTVKGRNLRRDSGSFMTILRRKCELFFLRRRRVRCQAGAGSRHPNAPRPRWLSEEQPLKSEVEAWTASRSSSIKALMSKVV